MRTVQLDLIHGADTRKLGRIVRELQFVRCERPRWFARVRNAGSVHVM